MDAPLRSIHKLRHVYVSIFVSLPSPHTHTHSFRHMRIFLDGRLCVSLKYTSFVPLESVPDFVQIKNHHVLI